MATVPRQLLADRRSIATKERSPPLVPELDEVLGRAHDVCEEQNQQGAPREEAIHQRADTAPQAPVLGSDREANEACHQRRLAAGPWLEQALEADVGQAEDAQDDGRYSAI